MLATYVITHLLNHSLGLISVATAEAGREWFVWFWRSLPATTVLYAAILTHPILGLAALYRRRTLRMPPAEAVQLAFGLAIPLLLTGHVAGTRLAHALFDRADTYTWHAFTAWTLRPELALKQITLATLAWTHACVGLHYWLRLRAWYRRAWPVVYAVMLLLPALALGGFLQLGREVAGWWQPADVERRRLALEAASISVEAQATLAAIEWLVYGLFGATLLALLAVRFARTVLARRQSVRVTYPGGPVVTVPRGFTVLEASRLSGVPHVSVCGGRGRCSTCRVRVERGADTLSPAGDAERRVLTRVGAGPGVRLACQARLGGDVAVTRLIAAGLPPGDALGVADAATGVEQDVAVLFADLRGFTSIAERKLPYDVVYLLNRYFEAVAGAVRSAGGIANQFTGDGVMALFGVGAPAADGCRAALLGAAAMLTSLDTLNRSLAGELPAPFRLGIGIHVGPAVIGRMGLAEAAYLTAVGDTVHVAARLEQLTKTYGCQLVISEAVATRAGVDVDGYRRETVTLRNRRVPLAVRVIDDAQALVARMSGQSIAGTREP